jgi:predicted RNase H-like HicB family nuclease
MKTYFAIFHKYEDSSYTVRFPDCSSIHTQGKDLDEALFMASDALGGMLVVGRKGREYEDPRPFEDVEKEAKEGEKVFPIIPSKTAFVNQGKSG